VDSLDPGPYRRDPPPHRPAAQARSHAGVEARAPAEAPIEPTVPPSRGSGKRGSTYPRRRIRRPISKGSETANAGRQLQAEDPGDDDGQVSHAAFIVISGRDRPQHVARHGSDALAMHAVTSLTARRIAGRHGSRCPACR
jgi:hypothetical protein